MKIPDKQALLELETVDERLEKAYALMEGEISVLQVEKRIRSRVKRQMEKTQREYYLNEQMKAIQKELGDGEEGKDETRRTREAHQGHQAVQGSARACRSGSEEAPPDVAHVGRSHRGAQLSRLVLSIPWGVKSKVKADLEFAQNVLDADHYGLDKVKERIVEYLAVAGPHQQAEGSDPLPRRPARRRQDLARQVDRESHGARIHPHVAGWRS